MDTTPRGYPYLEASDPPAFDPYLRELAEAIDADVEALADSIPSTGDAVAIFRTLMGPSTFAGTSGAAAVVPVTASAGDPGNALGITLGSDGRLTVTKAGAYLVLLYVQGESTTNGSSQLRKNGTALVSRTNGAGAHGTISRVIACAAGDIIDWTLTRGNAGTNVNLSTATLDIIKLGS